VRALQITEFGGPELFAMAAAGRMKPQGGGVHLLAEARRARRPQVSPQRRQACPRRVGPVSDSAGVALRGTARRLGTFQRLYIRDDVGSLVVQENAPRPRLIHAGAEEMVSPKSAHPFTR